MQEIKLADKPTIIISKELQAQITYLHHKVGKIEWSGVLFAKKIAGDISVPNTLIYNANYIFPMDIGSSTYTEFDYSSAIMDMFDVDSEIGDYKICGMHTHHNMAAFFSGTDVKELHDNAPHHNYYISLIVNFSCEPVARIAIVATEESGSITYKGSEGIETISLPNRQIMLWLECNMEYEVDEWLETRLEELLTIKKKKDALAVKAAAPQISKTYSPGKPLYSATQTSIDYQDTVDEDIQKAKVFLGRWLTGNMSITNPTLDYILGSIKDKISEKYMRELDNRLVSTFNTLFNEMDSPYVILADCADILDGYSKKYKFVVDLADLLDSFYYREEELNG
jgi:hypothetical protein